MKKHASSHSNLISIITAAACIGLPLAALAGDAALPVGSPAVTTIAATPHATFTPQAPALPTGASDVVRMYQGGISKDILVNYIDNSALSFHLNADGIIYLQQLGMPQDVTSAMLHRDGELQKMAGAAYQQQAAFAAANSQQAPAAAPAPAAMAAPPVVLPGTPAPVAPYAYAPDASGPAVYPDYSSVYPYYSYPYYGPNVIIGGGLGWGWGHGYGWGGRGFAHGGFGHGGFGGHR